MPRNRTWPASLKDRSLHEAQIGVPWAASADPREVDHVSLRSVGFPTRPLPQKNVGCGFGYSLNDAYGHRAPASSYLDRVRAG